MMMMAKTVVAAATASAAMIFGAKKMKNVLCAECECVVRRSIPLGNNVLYASMKRCSLSNRIVCQAREYGRDVPKRYGLLCRYIGISILCELSVCSGTNKYRNRDIFIELSSCLSASGCQGARFTLAHTIYSTFD